MARYCVCRSTNSSGFMINCDRCDEWFHGKCIGIKKKEADPIDKFFCEACLKSQPGLKWVYKPGMEPQPDAVNKSMKQEPPDEQHKYEKKVLEKIQSTSAQLKPSQKLPPPPVFHEQPKSGQGRKRINQRAKSKGYNHKQCANPDCIYEARHDSKYCSDQCGYQFNKLRYEKHFIPKWKILEENHSQARLKKMEDLDRLEKEKNEVELLIRNLKTENEELELNIKIIKEEAKIARCKTNTNSKSKDKDDEEVDVDNEDSEEIVSSDIAKAFCIICGLIIKDQTAFKHWSTCHKKHEASYNFTADIPYTFTSKEDDQPKLFCNALDKKTKRYCMHYASACPLHSNWQSDKDEVCGCPLDIKQKLIPGGDNCLELKKDCRQHYHWDRFRLAQMNMQRAQTFTRLDILNERIRIAAANLEDTYGGVVGVMLHETSNHRIDQVSPCEQQEEIDVDMV